MYEWYQEYYVGAAHGLAGIYYYLMQVRGGAFKLACGDVKLGKNPCLIDLLLGLITHPYF